MAMSRDKAEAILDEFEAFVRDRFARPITRRDISEVLDEHKRVCHLDDMHGVVELRKKPFDFLVDEVFVALPTIDKYFFEPDYRFHFLRDNGLVDLRISREEFVEDVQITRAHDGQRSRLQDELLAETGYAPGTGILYREKLTGQAIGISDAVDHTEMMERARKLISAVLEKKIAILYPDDMTLILGISRLDFCLYDDEDFDAVVEMAEQFLPRLRFAKIYVSDLYSGEAVRRLR